MIPISLRGPLVVRSPNWLGDAVMALPAVRNVKTLITGELLAVAAPEKLAALWEACPFVDRVIKLSQPRKLLISAGEIRAGKFGAALLLPNSLRAAAEARLAGIPQRIGYARGGGRRMLLSDAVAVPARNPLRLHQRFYYLDLVAALNAPPDDALPLLRRPALDSIDPVIAICPGAEYGPAKRWPQERFLEAARDFIGRYGFRPVIFGAAGDVAIAGELAAKLPEAENRAGQTSLTEFMRALAGAAIVLCNDSGAMHLASALSVPTVAIFGSTEPQMTGPLGQPTRVLRHHVPCSPCFLRECPIDFACMKSITPEMAVAAGGELLSEHR